MGDGIGIKEEEEEEEEEVEEEEKEEEEGEEREEREESKGQRTKMLDHVLWQRQGDGREHREEKEEEKRRRQVGVGDEELEADERENGVLVMCRNRSPMVLFIYSLQLTFRSSFDTD